ncbi:MAG: hypothetical protein MUD01_15435 [Chloroflexaceae bacterium]|jgi:hypothetical protein|nr:hypothetical protein [Chloroflexaceae bacterium]
MLQRFILALGLALCTFALGFWATSLVLGQPQQTAREQLLHQREFDGWQYRALVAVDAETNQPVNPQVTVSIESRVRDRAGLSRALAQQQGWRERLFAGQSSVAATIIPATPLPPEELAVFAQQHGVKISAYTIVARAANGELISMFGAPEGAVVFPAGRLATMVEQLQRNQQTTLTILGVAAIESEVSRTTLASLDQDGRILGVDLSSAIASADLVAATQVDRGRISVVPSGLYWAALEPR